MDFCFLILANDELMDDGWWMVAHVIDNASYGSPNSEKINCTSAGVYVRRLIWRSGRKRGVSSIHPLSFFQADMGLSSGK